LEYYTDTKKESATIATDAEFIVNGLVSAVKDVKAQLSAPNAFITLIDNDQNGNYEVVSIDRYTNLWMRGVSYTGDGLRFTWNFDLAATEVLFGGGVLVEMFDKDGNKIEYNKPAEGQYDADGNVVMVYDLSMVLRGYVDMITCERKIATEEELDYVESYIRLMNAGRDYLTLEIRGVVEGEMMAGEILVPLAAKIKEEVISQSLFYRVIVTLNDGPPAIEIVIGDR